MAETGKEARPPLLRADAALFLDFDGTLAAYAPHPDGVTIDAGLPDLLARARERQGGALAIVTGRTLDALDALLGPPRYAAAGLHGLEWRLATGKTHRYGSPAGARRILAAVVERFGDDRRLVIEDKGAGVALHFRRAPERATPRHPRPRAPPIRAFHRHRWLSRRRRPSPRGHAARRRG